MRRGLELFAAILFSASLVEAAPPQVPRVAVEDKLGAPSVLGGALPALGVPPFLPLLVRIVVDSEQLAEGGDLDRRLAEFSVQQVRVWISIPTPPDQQAAAVWRNTLSQLLTRHKGRTAILELRIDAPGAVSAFAIRAAATDLRNTNPGALLAVAGPAIGGREVDRLVTRETAPYVDLLAVPERSVVAELLALTRKTAPAIGVVVYGQSLQPDAEPREALARAHVEALAEGVTTVAWSLPSTVLLRALPALRPLAPILTGDVEFLSGPSSPLTLTHAEGGTDAISRWLFFDGRSFATYLVYSGPSSPQGLRVSVNAPLEGTPVVHDLVAGQRRTAAGYVRDSQANRTQIEVPLTGHLMLVDFNEGAATIFGERSDVSAERQLSVEEVIARHRQQQASQDGLIRHYAASARMEQHFRPNVADPGYDVVTDNRYFSAGDGVEWQELSFSVNGSKWGADRPAFPLLQPEKVLSLPLQLRFTDDYRYRLDGRERVDGFDCYVIRFEPHRAGTSLYKGTLWIDAKTFARVRVQAVQTQLSAPIVSNDETLKYAPVTSIDGRPIFLLTELLANQIVLIAGRNLLVEKAIRFSDFAVNGEQFQSARESARNSEAVMYRDTDKGLRYYVKENGKRVVSERPTMRAKAMAMGVTFDPSFAFPLPIFGINYLDFDFGGPNSQLALLFAGVLAAGNIQKPKLGNTPFDASVDFFAIAVPATDRLFADGRDLESQRVLTWPVSTGVNFGWQATPFQKLSLSYQFRFDAFVKDRTTTDDFEVPDSTVTNGIGPSYEYRRAGYSLVANATWFDRASWTAWGSRSEGPLPEPQRRYVRYGVSLSRDLYFGFHKIHMNGAYFGGRDLDRFSRYQFGMFDDTRIHGVPASGLRFDELGLVRGSYSFNIFDQYRLDLFLEHAQGIDESIDSKRQKVTGIGVAVNVRAPFNTIFRADLGRSFLPRRYSGVGSTVLQILILKPLR